jgi:homoaconitate hydratase
MAGYISSVPGYREVEPVGSFVRHTSNEQKPEPVPILKGFPESIEGELVFCYQDNLNTDGIFPGKYTYIDDFSPRQQAAVVMENYDPGFSASVNEGDILVGGFNFGTGSSREQAATAFKHRGIQLVLAGSFSETYKRNALNNGFLVLAIPRLVQDLKERFGSEHLTVRTGLVARIDFADSSLTANDHSYSIGPIGTAAQELIIAGGLENWTKSRLL